MTKSWGWKRGLTGLPQGYFQIAGRVRALESLITSPVLSLLSLLWDIALGHQPHHSLETTVPLLYLCPHWFRCLEGCSEVVLFPSLHLRTCSRLIPKSQHSLRVVGPKGDFKSSQNWCKKELCNLLPIQAMLPSSSRQSRALPLPPSHPVTPNPANNLPPYW